LHWGDALELIGHLGQVEPRGEDEFAFIVGTQREVFKRPRTPEFGTEEVSRLRRFLKNAGAETSTSKPAQPCRMVVVIDHHAAHVFQELGGTQRVHRKEAHYRGYRVPEETPFYEEVAKALGPAAEIVLIGHGTGKSNAAKVLAEYLEKHHPETSRAVKATETADLSSLTEAQAEGIAKRHMIPVT
jgi:hypothetical protein